MDGGAAAAIEVLVQTLVNVTKEEISLIRGLDKDAEQLQTTLGMIQSYLNDAEKKVITQEAVKNWLRELETLAFRADNVLDEFNYHLLHQKIKTCKNVIGIMCYMHYEYVLSNAGLRKCWIEDGGGCSLAPTTEGSSNLPCVDNKTESCMALFFSDISSTTVDPYLYSICSNLENMKHLFIQVLYGTPLEIASS